MKINIGSQTVEDYLKTIFTLEEVNDRVKTTILAERLGITPGSVTDMVQRLAKADPQLIDYKSHRGVKLTPAGRQRALNVIRRHRLLETFLHDILKFGWEEVHQEAEVLEHHLSERVTDAIDHLLGYPSADPHGEAIPSKNGDMTSAKLICLSEAVEGNSARVARVHPPESEMLSYLDTLGIGVDTHLVVDQVAPFNGPMTLRMMDTDAQHSSCSIGREVTDCIFVEILS